MLKTRKEIMEIKTKYGKYLNPTKAVKEKQKKQRKKIANNAHTHTRKEIMPGMSVIK